MGARNITSITSLELHKDENPTDNVKNITKAISLVSKWFDAASFIQQKKTDNAARVALTLVLTRSSFSRLDPEIDKLIENSTKEQIMAFIDKMASEGYIPLPGLILPGAKFGIFKELDISYAH